MKIALKWFLTGRETEIEERDELLGPNTTILEVKGLIQLKYSYPAKHMLVIVGKSLRENEETLAACGITDQESALRHENILTVHVLSGAELEGDEDAEEEDDNAVDPTTGSSIHEFTHEDFIKASKMLGRDLPVSSGRAAQVRAAPPRARPAFLDAKPAGATADAAAAHTEGGATATAATTDGPAPTLRVYDIFGNVYYGLRKQGAEKRFGFQYPGIDDFFDFWDLRLNHEGHKVAEGQIVLEIFFFGEFEKVDKDRFKLLATEHMKQVGFRIEPVGEIREAGCMYPLIAVPIIMSEAEAMQLGDEVYEKFGQRPTATGAAPPVRGNAASGPAGSGKEKCIVM